MLDRKWNSQTMMAQLNASCHSDSERADRDYYATPPKAVEMLLDLEQFNHFIKEPACWEGHISKVLEARGHHVLSSDIINRWYKDQWEEEPIVIDFLNYDNIWYQSWYGDIITNPPYAKANEFLEMCMFNVREWAKVAFLLRVQFLEWVARHKLFMKYPPKTVYVSSRTLRCAKNWDFANATWNASTYCWFVREKWFTGDPVIKWFNF